jgi:hypothetical protein
VQPHVSTSHVSNSLLHHHRAALCNDLLLFAGEEGNLGHAHVAYASLFLRELHKRVDVESAGPLEVVHRALEFSHCVLYEEKTGSIQGSGGCSCESRQWLRSSTDGVTVGVDERQVGRESKLATDIFHQRHAVPWQEVEGREFALVVGDEFAVAWCTCAKMT